MLTVTVLAVPQGVIAREEHCNSTNSTDESGSRVVKVPFEMELSSVPVPKIWWNCLNFSVQSYFPTNTIGAKLELSSVQVPKLGWNCRN